MGRIKKHDPDNAVKVHPPNPPINSVASVNPYQWIDESLISKYGEPDYEITVPGQPRGFTVARKKERTPGTAKSYLWAQTARTILSHVYDIDCLEALEDRPMIFYTEAWFESGNHADPENVQKLAKDALFYLSPHPKDKYTAGFHCGPLYHLVKPRTEIKIWVVKLKKPASVRLKNRRMASSPPITYEDAPRNSVRVAQTKVANPFGMIKVEDKENDS